jgi:apolipoprotein N-acyltransferase
MNIILVLVSSLLYVLAFPRWNLWWVSFAALAPLLGAVERGHGYIKPICYGSAWSLAVSIGLGYWLFPALFYNYGVSFSKTVLFFCVCVYLPLTFLVVGFMGCYRLLQRRHVVFYALIAPSLWTIMEYIKEAVPFLVPWGELGYAVIDFHPFVQAADVIGVHGITFIVAGINFLVFFIISETYPVFSANRHAAWFRLNFNGKHRIQMTTGVMIIGLFFSVPMLYGKIRLQSMRHTAAFHESHGESMDASLIQGNFNSIERWSGMGFYPRIQKYLEMTGSGEGKGKRVIVWPETVLNSTTRLDESFFTEIMTYIGRDALLIAGGLKEDETTGGVLNSAYLVSGTGRLMRYDKHMLLPYAETSPLIDLIGAYYTAPNQFQAGTTPLCFQTDHGRAGVSICFEIMYPDLIRKSVSRGAEFLVNISNDAWFGNSSMPYVHLNAARFRAVENRRYVLRASNSGFSAVIAPDGAVLSQSRLFESERIEGRFIKLDELNAYSRFGSTILYFCAVCIGAGLVRIIYKR